MHNRYGKLAAWVYALDKPIGRSFGDLEFYRSRLENIEGPILEPAVGNGRIMVPLLEAGLPVVGFDASDDMLAYCRDECRRRGLVTDLTKQTFADFRYDTPFSAIILPAGSFQLITDTATACTVLRRFHDALAPGGRLIVDLDPIGSFFGTTPSVRHWDTGTGDLLTLTEQHVETSHIDQTTLSHLRYDLWRDGALVQSELDLFKLRWWGVAEFAMALREAGFGDVNVAGAYQFGRTPQEGDDVISFEASRVAP